MKTIMRAAGWLLGCAAVVSFLILLGLIGAADQGGELRVSGPLYALLATVVSAGLSVLAFDVAEDLQK